MASSATGNEQSASLKCGCGMTPPERLVVPALFVGAALRPIIAPGFYRGQRIGRGAFSPCDTRRMIDRSALSDELTETWHREIPIVAAMGVTVESYDGRSLAVRA